MKLLILAMLLVPIYIHAQDASDVETKAYGSYAGGKFDTVDVSTGNLFLEIPLISYTQQGKLPPLSFSVELNNAPYTSLEACYPTDDGEGGTACLRSYSRYDTSAPGASPAYNLIFGAASAGQGTVTGKVGAYITSSYEGPIVNGTAVVNPVYPGEGSSASVEQYAQMLYSLIDPSGKTHALESDTSNWNYYHAQDGSGWSFTPAGSGNAYDYFDPENEGIGIPSTPAWPSQSYWLTTPAPTSTGLRLGSISSPTGIQYSSQFVSEPSLTRTYQSGTGSYSISKRLLTSTATDPLGNSITRGPWYWTDSANLTVTDLQAFYSDPSTHPLYVDSIGRSIPDVVSLQETVQGSATGGPGTCPTGSTANFVWNPPGPGGNNLNYTFCYTYTTFSLALEANATASNPHPDSRSTNLLTAVVLPNGTQWNFAYDSQTANLTRVGLPTGGSITYSYQLVNDGRCPQMSCVAVASRTEDDGLGNLSTNSYAFNSSTGSSELPTFTTTETDSLNNDTVHKFNFIGGGTSSQVFETGTVYYQGSSTASSATVLKSIATAYEYLWDYTGSSAGFRAIGVFPSHVSTTTPGGTSNIDQSYSSDVGSPLFTARRIVCDSSNTVAGGDNPSSCQDSLPSANYPQNNANARTNAPNLSYLEPSNETLSWGSTPLRITTTQYQFQADSRYKAANMISLLHSVQMQDAGYYWQQPAASVMTYGYDEANGSPQGIYGNATSKSTVFYMNGLGNSSTFSSSTGTVFNSNGMPITTIDPNGNQTHIVYDATGLFVYRIERPPTNVGHIDYYSYDAATGLLNSHTDENGTSPGDAAHTTSYSYDQIGRVTAISYPDGGGSTFCYTDTGGGSCSKNGPPFKLYTNTTASPDPAIQTMHTYDGLGRSIQSSVISDALGADIVDTTYDSEGRVHSVSNPYRVTSTENASSVGETVYTYDALGRKVLQRQPDGNLQHWCYDGIPVNGEKNCWTAQASMHNFDKAAWTDFTDETGRHTQQISNPLGELIAVMEPPSGAGAASLQTDYTYDVLGDLLSVSQAGSSGNTPRTRFFSYYAASLVQTACNPETLASGQTCSGFMNPPGIWYTFYPNGNVQTKIDSQFVTTTYQYDALNRLLSKTYSGDQTGTASSCYQYDNTSTANGSGRLATQWTQAGACASSPPPGALTRTSILAYDVMGRPVSQQQCTLTICSTDYLGQHTYSYNLAGKLSAYGDGRGAALFSNSYDGAGRLQSMNSSWSDSTHPASLFTALEYSPHSAIVKARYGGSLNLNRVYDSRLRIITETDTGVIMGYPEAPATITISGSEGSR